MPQIQKTVPAVPRNTSFPNKLQTMTVGGGVTTATYTPAANIKGQDTNTRMLSLVNKGQSGSGNQVMASVTLVNGINMTAGVPYNVPLQNVSFQSGDEIYWDSDAIGTGLADPGGVVTVNY